MRENLKADYERHLPLLAHVCNSLESEVRDSVTGLDVPFRVAFNVATVEEFLVKAGELQLDNPLVEFEGQVTGVILVKDANAIRHVENELEELLSVVEAKWEGKASDVRRLFCVIPPQAKPPGWDANDSLPRTFELEIKSSDDLPAAVPSTVSIPISDQASTIPTSMNTYDDEPGLTAEKPFDVFLAHNSKDKPEIRLLAEALAFRGIKPWIDADQIAPGQSFQDSIQSAIQNVRAIAICVGRDGLGKWQEWELKAAISKCVDVGIPVVPVLLPEVEELPNSLLFLRELNSVKFEANTQEETQVLRLIWGIRGTKPSELNNVEGRQLESRQASEQRVPSGQPGRSRGVIFGLHGIRTHAGWHRTLYEVLGNYAWQVRTERWTFGHFSIVKFLSPWARTAKVQWFREVYLDEKKDRRVQLSERSEPSIVAHSFGTYILGNAMLKYDWLKFDKIILCGSILPVDFPWDKLIERGQVASVRNEYGVQDFWVKRVRLFVPDTGPSGYKSFACEHERFHQERFSYSHSEYFSSGHMEEKWIPFLESQIAPLKPNNLNFPARNPSRPYGLYFTQLILLAGIVALVAWGISGFTRTDTDSPVPQESIPEMTKENASSEKAEESESDAVGNPIDQVSGDFRRSGGRNPTSWREIDISNPVTTLPDLIRPSQVLRFTIASPDGIANQDIESWLLDIQFGNKPFRVLRYSGELTAPGEKGEQQKILIRHPSSINATLSYAIVDSPE